MASEKIVFPREKNDAITAKCSTMSGSSDDSVASEAKEQEVMEENGKEQQ